MIKLNYNLFDCVVNSCLSCDSDENHQKSFHCEGMTESAQGIDLQYSKNGCHLIILLYASKLALLASFMCLKFKIIFGS